MKKYNPIKIASILFYIVGFLLSVNVLMFTYQIFGTTKYLNLRSAPLTNLYIVSVTLMALLFFVIGYYTQLQKKWVYWVCLIFVLIEILSIVSAANLGKFPDIYAMISLIPTAIVVINRNRFR